MVLAPLHFPEVKVYLGPEGELKVNGKKKTPPYAKIWPGSAEEMTITKAGESVSFLSSTKSIKARITDEILCFYSCSKVNTLHWSTPP